MERMNNKKRNTIIIVVVLALLLIALCIWGVSCGKSKDLDANVAGEEINVTGDQRNDVSEGTVNTETVGQQSDDQGNGSDSDADGSNEQDFADKELQETDMDSKQNEDAVSADIQDEAGVKQKVNAKAGSSGKQSNRVNNSSAIGDNRTGKTDTNSQNVGTSDGEDEKSVTFSTGKFQTSSESYSTLPELYIPPTEDINLSDEIETDESGAIVFPYVSYQ